MTQLDQFSEREKEVLKLLLQGKSNKQIALELGISNRTVEFHLGNIYVKLGVTSRAETIVKLSESHLLESTGDFQGKSPVEEIGEPGDNGGKPFSLRRIPMKNLVTIIGGGLLTTALVVVLVLANPPTKSAEILPTETIGTTQIPATPMFIPSPIVSPKEHILEQIRQLAAEYNQAVQAEKQNGKVEFSKDPNTGDDIFLFKDESYVRISELFSQFMIEKTKLDNLYTQIYRGEAQPTPFPAQSSVEQDRAYYEFLMGHADEYCSLDAWQQDSRAETVMVYDPDEGKYQAIFTGATIARCEVFGQMLEEFRVAPIIAKVNKDADMAMIRQVTGKSDLRLSFQSITPLANAPGQSAALYTDETGTKYYVDVETSRLAQIEPNFPTHPDIPADKTKSIDELRMIAEQFALANSPRLAELKSVFVYEEGDKGSIYFFTWRYSNKDWSGTDWMMMPPFLQIGVLADGQIVTYINTLDLFK